MHLFTHHFLSGRPQPGGLMIFKAVKYLQHGSLFQHKYDKIILEKWKTWDYPASLLRNHLTVNSDRTSSHTHTQTHSLFPHAHSLTLTRVGCWPWTADPLSGIISPTLLHKSCMPNISGEHCTDMSDMLIIVSYCYMLIIV